MKISSRMRKKKKKRVADEQAAERVRNITPLEKAKAKSDDILARSKEVGGQN